MTAQGILAEVKMFTGDFFLPTGKKTKEGQLHLVFARGQNGRQLPCLLASSWPGPEHHLSQQCRHAQLRLPRLPGNPAPYAAHSGLYGRGFPLLLAPTKIVKSWAKSMRASLSLQKFLKTRECTCIFSLPPGSMHVGCMRVVAWPSCVFSYPFWITVLVNTYKPQRGRHQRLLVNRLVKPPYVN